MARFWLRCVRLVLLGLSVRRRWDDAAMEAVLTVKEFAAEAGVTARTVERWHSIGRVTIFTVGGFPVLLRSELAKVTPKVKR